MKKSTSRKKAKPSPGSPKGPSKTSKSQPSSQLNKEALLEALAFMKENGLSHFEYRAESLQIALSLGKTAVVQQESVLALSSQTSSQTNLQKTEPKGAHSNPAASTQNGSAAMGTLSAKEKKTITIDSPFVGTFYRSPGPNQDSFVEVGQIVDKGQALCIIEAMKLMNEIESDCKGRVLRVLVDNATPVEFGEPLFEIEPL